MTPIRRSVLLAAACAAALSLVPAVASDVLAKADPNCPADAGPDGVLVVSRVAPDFPGLAIRRRVESGRVTGRIAIDGRGNVTGVQIVDAYPQHVFDDAVREALAGWQFNAGAEGRTHEARLEFWR